MRPLLIGNITISSMSVLRVRFIATTRAASKADRMIVMTYFGINISMTRIIPSTQRDLV